MSVPCAGSIAARERDQLILKASVDGLTRCWNRAAIVELLSAELARARRGSPTCMAMIDADHFKKVNDTHGHPAGDAVLIEIAARIRRAVREFDAVGRYGGEGFLVVLSNCNRDACRKARGYTAICLAAHPTQTCCMPRLAPPCRAR